MHVAGGRRVGTKPGSLQEHHHSQEAHCICMSQPPHGAAGSLFQTLCPPEQMLLRTTWPASPEVFCILTFPPSQWPRAVDESAMKGSGHSVCGCLVPKPSVPSEWVEPLGAVEAPWSFPRFGCLGFGTLVLHPTSWCARSGCIHGTHPLQAIP